MLLISTKSYISDTNLFDMWRILNVTNREYFFHSVLHSLYICIGYFLLDGKLSEIHNAEYKNSI